MDHKKASALRWKGFYENTLTNDILPFWLERCSDEVNGGYFNCYDNTGKTLVSRDKYTWSQGRFVWIFSRLSEMERLFRKEERERFFRLAKSGADFLTAHCALPGEPLRCAYLMDDGQAEKRTAGRPYMSIYADCFVIFASGAVCPCGAKPVYDFELGFMIHAGGGLRRGISKLCPTRFRRSFAPMAYR